MSERRHPRDGRPFYCIKCGLGYGEYIACELPDCQLESKASAELRSLAWEIPDTKARGDS